MLGKHPKEAYGEGHKGESTLRIAIHAGGNVDQIAERCRETSVDEIFLGATSVPGFAAQGHLTPEDFQPFREMLAERNVLVSGMIIPKPSREAVLGQDEKECANICQTLRTTGQSGVDTALLYPLDSFLHFHEYYPGRPLTIMPGEDGWDSVIDFFRQVVGVADEVGLKLANHLWAVDVVHAIWEAVDSPNNGVTYCQGMSLIGEDPHTPINTWGIARIFFAHARNHVRRGPCLMDHDEVPLDRGDVDMARCVEALTAAEYNGLIAPEHLGPQSMADATAYLRKLI